MSAFSEMLSNEISENDMSVMRIAACANISRSTVTKIVSGQKVPTLDELVAIMSVMPLSKAKRCSLMKELDNARFGRAVCDQMDEILKKTELSYPLVRLFKQDKDITEHTLKPDNGIKMIDTRTELLIHALEAIRIEIQNHDAPILYTNYTSDYKMLQESVISLLAGVSDKVNFKICTQITKNARKKQLDNFVNIFDCAPFFVGNCDILFEYACEKADIIPFGFTNYIVLSDEVIFINDHADKALVVTERETVNGINEMCRIRMNGMKSLVRRCASVFELFEFMRKVPAKFPCTYYLQHDPCVAPFFEYEQMQQIARTEIPEVKEVLPSLYEYYGAYKNGMRGAFSRTGLYEFARTGIINEFPSEYTKPVPVEIRRYVLTKMLNAMKNNISDFRIINENFINFSVDTITDYVKDFQLMFTWRPPEANGFVGSVSVVTNEATLLEEASTFFEVLFESRYLYTREQSADIIAQCINELR